MTNYSKYSSHVRVERFKPGGKWYDTWEVDMTNYWRQDAIKIEELGDITLPGTWAAVYFAIINEMKKLKSYKDYTPKELYQAFSRWTWVCLEPYHEHVYPIMFVAKEIW